MIFIGDRGTGVGSRIKSLRRYWWEKIHSEAVNVCITNGNLTSQTCVFCFESLSSSTYKTASKKMVKIYTRHMKGVLYCSNPDCVSVIKKKALKSRDTLSALAISLVGLSTVLFGSLFSPFHQSNISEQNTEQFNHKTSTFKL